VQEDSSLGKTSQEKKQDNSKELFKTFKMNSQGELRSIFKSEFTIGVDSLL